MWWLYFSLGWKLSHKISWLLKVTMHDEWWLKDGPFWSRTWGLLKFVRGSKSKELCGDFDDGETTPPWTKSPRSGQNEDEKYPEFIATIKCQIDYLYINLLSLPDFLPLMQNKNSTRFVHNLQNFISGFVYIQLVFSSWDSCVWIFVRKCSSIWLRIQAIVPEFFPIKNVFVSKISK